MGSLTGLAAASSSQIAQQQYILDLQDNGKHKFKASATDADGDGKNDGDAVNGDEASKGDNAAAIAIASLAKQADSNSAIGSVTSDPAAGATDALTSRGISVNAKGLSSVDGFDSDSPNAIAALDFSGPPALPDDDGLSTRSASLKGTVRAADPKTIVTTDAKLSDFLYRTGGEDSALMWEALSTMAKTSMRDVKDANELKNALQTGKIEAKKNEIKSTQEQIDAERAAAGYSLGFAIASAAVQIGTSSMPGSAYAVGQAVAPLIKSMGEYMNKTMGPQKEADQKKVETMRHQMMQEVMEQGIENAKSSYDEAKESMKLALKILTEQAERRTQISSTITRT